MRFILSLDGLSIHDLYALEALLPKSWKHFQALSRHKLDSLTFTTTQPIWAQILTGQPWYVSGCVGYAKPTGSLNKLSVVSEKELLAPCTVANTDRGHVAVVNVPLLRPRPENRHWLSDGSLPINKVVSPSSLLAAEPFASYKARPFSDIAALQGATAAIFESCMNVELNRLECVVQLLALEKWSLFIWRLSIFDHLSHLIGVNFLRARNLSFFPRIERFLLQLDEVILKTVEQAQEFVAISAFSHVPCEGGLNLNAVLRQGGFFELDETTAPGRGSADRLQAAAAVKGAKPPDCLLSTMEGRIKGSSTKAASPVAGCVFVNSRAAFSDGSVSDADYASVRSSVGAYLRERLFRRFGERCIIEESPLPGVVVSVPEFIVKIDGVELHDMEDIGQRGYDLPRTTHQSTGFVLLPAGRCAEQSVAPSQLREFLNHDGRGSTVGSVPVG